MSQAGIVSRREDFPVADEASRASRRRNARPRGVGRAVRGRRPGRPHPLAQPRRDRAHRRTCGRAVRRRDRAGGSSRRAHQLREEPRRRNGVDQLHRALLAHDGRRLPVTVSSVPFWERGESPVFSASPTRTPRQMAARRTRTDRTRDPSSRPANRKHWRFWPKASAHARSRRDSESPRRRRGTTSAASSRSSVRTHASRRSCARTGSVCSSRSRDG